MNRPLWIWVSWLSDCENLDIWRLCAGSYQTENAMGWAPDPGLVFNTYWLHPSL